MEFRTKQDQVAEILRERIIVGEYPRGRKLKQVELSKELGVSVTPVREALKILEAEGYVVGLSHRGVLIPTLDRRAAREVLELRLLLEGELTRHAIGRVTPQAYNTLREIQNDCVNACVRDDRVAVRRANYRFHFTLYGLAQRPRSLRFVRVLWAAYPFTDIDVVPGRSTRMVGEHDSFLAHLGAGETEAAIKAMEAHIRSGWSEMDKDGNCSAA